MTHKIHEKYYKKISGRDSEFERVKHYFNSRISVIYGDQEEALNKIIASRDRTCELLIGKNSKDYGVVVYKNKLTPEFKSLSYPGAFEIKTFFVVEPNKYPGQGIATNLLNHLSKKACDLQAQCVFVTVSSKSPEALAFFLSNGFRIKTIKSNLYLKGDNEYFLFHDNPALLLKNTQSTLSPSPEGKNVLHLASGSFRDTELSKLEAHVINFLQTQEFPKEFFLDYYGFQLSDELINQSICKFVDWIMRWQQSKLARRYVILFINPLYEDEKKNNQIGEIIIGITENAEKHLLACIPSSSLPQNFWEQIFKCLKIRGVGKVDIFCSKQDKLTFNAGLSFYPSMKIEKLSYPKLWSPNDFSSYELFHELSHDVQYATALFKDDLLLQEAY